MKRVKLISLILVILLLVLFLTVNASVEQQVTTTDPDLACKKVFYNLVAAENTQNWDQFCNLFTEDQIKEEKKFFQSYRKVGVKYIKTASLVEIQYLDSKDSDMNINSNYRNYIVGVDYTVSKEDKYYFNGVNYHLMTLKLENGTWKILEYQDAPLENYIPDDKSYINNEGRAEAIVKVLPNLNPKNVKTMLDIIDARTLGIIINAKGEFLGSNNEDVKSAEDARKLLDQVKSESSIVQ